MVSILAARVRLPDLARLGAVSVAVLATCHAAAAPFTEGVLSNGAATSASGQSFGPGVEPDPATTGFAPGDPVLLNSVEFISGGTGVGADETYLAIMPAAFFDFNGDPDGTFTPTIGDAVGISINSYDATSLAFGDSMLFTFDNGLQVTYGDVLSAVFVTIGASDEITPVATSVAFILFVEDPPGTFAPAANYGGTGNFDATALFPDSGNDGFFEGSSDATDLSFVANFSEIPEPASITLAGLSLALMLGLRTYRR